MSITLRKAVINDAETIQQLVSHFANKGVMLPRSLNSVYENIRDFWVATNNEEIIGCGALHVVGWQELAEIKSLSVKENAQEDGIGKKIIDQCIDEAKTLGINKIFALTFVPKFFYKCGFYHIEKSTLPHKIWSDCIDCPYFPNCEEVAVRKDI